MNRKLISALLALALGLLPLSASAETPVKRTDPVQIFAEEAAPRPRTAALNLMADTVSYFSTDGTIRTADPITDITDSAEGWSWVRNPASYNVQRPVSEQNYFGILTLTGANIRGNDSDGDRIGLQVPPGTIVELAEGTRSFITGGNSDNGSSYGLTAPGPFLLRGRGNLTAAGGAAAVGSYGIEAGSSITLEGGLVAASGGADAADSCGIFSSESILVNSGTVTASGETRAMYPAPGLAGYENPVVSASSSSSGIPAVPYQESGIAGYRYLRIGSEPVPAPAPTPSSTPVSPRCTISASAGRGGTVSPAGDISVPHGKDQKFQFEPEAGNWLAALLLDGKAGKARGASHTFENVVNDHSLRALFLPFADMAAEDWFTVDVAVLFDRELIAGVCETEFSPQTPMSRGMLAAVLYRAAGCPSLEGENLGYPFEDIDATAYYGNAVYWARLHGYMVGVGTNSFAPEAPVTREQLAAVLYRCKGSPEAGGDLSQFTDAGTAGSYALPALSWAVEQGVLMGRDTVHLAPGGTASRAETAAMLHRYLNLK